MARPRRKPQQWASAQDIERVQDKWTDAQLECRDLGHHWHPLDVIHVARRRLGFSAGYYRISHGCGRCGMVRIRELSEAGHLFAQTYRYPDGYLAEGVGRIAGEAKDAVRLASIKRHGVTEITGKAKDDDLPRFGVTRRELEQ